LCSIASISSSIASRHFSPCTFSATLKSFSAYCSCNFEISFSSSKRCFYQTYFLLSKLVCSSALPITSFSILSCKYLWITNTSLQISELSKVNIFTIELSKRLIELSNVSTCSTNLSKLSTCSTELPRLPTELFELFTCSSELCGLFTFFIALSRLSEYLTDLSNLLGCQADLSSLLDCLAECSLLLDCLVEFSTLLGCLWSSPLACARPLSYVPSSISILLPLLLQILLEPKDLWS